MIPKIIHYCWLSDEPIPKKNANCIKTWKTILPDYEFVLWDLKKDNVGEILWVKEAFETKKYAFAADFIRIYALYQYGGIYLDTDVEVIKNFDPLLTLPYFVGTEGDGWIEAAVLGAEKNADWLLNILEYFDKPFIKKDGSLDMTTLPQVMNKIISRDKTIKVVDESVLLQNIRQNYNTHFYLFKKEYFSAKDMGTGIITKTSNTYCIHHFAMSWIPKKDKNLSNFKRRLIGFFGTKNILLIIKLLHLKQLKDRYL
ncbi:glycosyltransferase family 32 protein [Halpernia frigidisoli]|uniref:Glycosyltransferase sugar-binding region containing DXD motif-containing protein n=1 Tax=Halpernia frigidisoli TaxID=1125876 RepID=A0A1I3FEB9_9FLAO|nr:glycosyltransferase [Halpernia frigidisoli]SFI09569.1 Glycosyltransferase sugar-binding region containing DXD motif-containing protein [Halpernia frigidisoli]